MFTATKDDSMANLKNPQSLRSAAGEAASEAGDELRDAANRAGRRVRSAVHTASEDISHVKDTVASEIRSNPMRSSMVALGVGVLLGALLRR